MHNWFYSKHFQNPDVRKNFFLNVFDGSVFSFAMSFVSLQTVLPVYVKRIGGSDIAVGLIPVIWLIGFNFPQIFISNYVRHKDFKKQWMLKTAMVQRIPWLLLALITFFFFEKVSRDTALLIFFLGLALAAVSGSINMPGWYDLVSKVTPVKLRGRLFAYRSVLGAGLGILGGWIVSIILNLISYPENFALLFLMAFLIMMVSYSFLIFLVEREPNKPKELLTNRQFLTRLGSIIKKEKNFRNFLIADSLLMIALMSHAFFAVSAFEKFSLSDSYAGYFTVAMMISMVFGSLYFGYLADKHGHRLNLLWAVIFTLIACIAALASPSVEIYYLCFAGSALTISLNNVSRLAIVSEICREEDRPTYISLTNFITAPFILSGLLGGWIANLYGYEIVFIISAIAAFLSVLWLFIMVEEPRMKYLKH